MYHILRTIANDTQPTQNRNTTTDSQEPCRGSVRLRGGHVTRIPDVPFLAPAHVYAIPAHIPAIPIVANKDSKTPTEYKTCINYRMPTMKFLKLPSGKRIQAIIKLSAITDVALCVCILASLRFISTHPNQDCLHRQGLRYILHIQQLRFLFGRSLCHI